MLALLTSMMTTQEFEAAMVHFNGLMARVEADGRKSYHDDLGVDSRVGTILATDSYGDDFCYEVNYETGAVSVYEYSGQPEYDYPF